MEVRVRDWIAAERIRGSTTGTSPLFPVGGKFCAGYNQIARSNNQPRGAVESNIDLATAGKFMHVCIDVIIPPPPPLLVALIHFHLLLQNPSLLS